VIQLNLSDIPPISQQEILTGLTDALTHFGEILDIGLYRESGSRFFLGAGYAVIQQLADKTYPQLHHTISWGDSGLSCYATFPDMPTWCRYCHSEGHTKFECTKAKASILCYACDHYGHRSAECPSPKSSKLKGKPFKKARKTHIELPNNTNESNQPAASVELMKSKHAPKTPEDKQANNDTVNNPPRSIKPTIPVPEGSAEDQNMSEADEEDDDEYIASDENEESDSSSASDMEVSDHELENLKEEADQNNVAPLLDPTVLVVQPNSNQPMTDPGLAPTTLNNNNL
jgi:hypothetical protein